MGTKILLFLLPTLSLATINIDICLRTKNYTVEFSGSEASIISDVEIKSFKLEDEALKKAATADFGEKPDDVYLRSPTPWDDLYKSYGWKPVQRTLQPVKATIKDLKSVENVVIASEVFENNATAPVNFYINVPGNIQHKASFEWIQNANLTVKNEISHGISIEASKFTFTVPWGNSSEHLENVSVGTPEGIQVPVSGKQKVKAEIHAIKNVLEVEVEYEAKLSGDIAINYAAKYKDHHFWALNVANLMRNTGLKNSLKSKEIMTIELYCEPKIVVAVV